MDNLVVKSILAGVFFGIWPLLMNRSGLNGNISSVVFSGVILICVSPFALMATGNIQDTNWIMAIGAGVFGALGLLAFNGVLANATKTNVSSLFVLMILTQVAVPAVYNVITNGGLTIVKGMGFALAIIAAVLLLL